MADYPKDLRYTKDHEWARKEGARVVVGVTDHAQSSLGDVVYVELPKVGTSLVAGQSFGVMENSRSMALKAVALCVGLYLSNNLRWRACSMSERWARIV